MTNCRVRLTYFLLLLGMLLPLLCSAAYTASQHAAPIGATTGPAASPNYGIRPSPDQVERADAAGSPEVRQLWATAPWNWCVALVSLIGAMVGIVSLWQDRGLRPQMNRIEGNSGMVRIELEQRQHQLLITLEYIVRRLA